MKVVQLYRVFDNLFLHLEDAEKHIEGWEHKETIQVNYAALQNHEVKRFEESPKGVPVYDIYARELKEQAEADLLE